MTTAIASTSKAFPFSQGDNKFGEFISDIPRFYAPTMTTVVDDQPSFRTTSMDTYVTDPELFMGDDCDTYYQQTLMNSDFLQPLNNDIDGYTKTNKDLNVNLFCSSSTQAHQRLEMLLAHVVAANQSFNQQVDIDGGSNAQNNKNNKGKGKLT
jgi:hypothetical protein